MAHAGTTPLADRRDAMAVAASVIARLQATGQIDIRADLSIRFTGDQRVLDDLELLAQSGYGEDHFGNNTTLPKELGYLRR